MIYSIPSELLLSYPLLVTGVTCAVMLETEAWGGMATGSGVAVMSVGVSSMIVRD